MLKQLQETEAEIRSKVLKVGALLTLALILSLQLDWVLGYVFGLITSLLMFRLLALTIDKSIKKAAAGARSFVFSRYLTRYIIYGLIIYVALTRDHLNIMATIVGLLMVKLVIIGSELYGTFKIYLHNLVENN